MTGSRGCRAPSGVRRGRWLIAAWACLFALAAAADDFRHADYKPSTLVDAAEGQGIHPETDYWLDAAHPKFQTRVTYTGKIRPINPESARLIAYWVKAMQHPPEVKNLFVMEVEVRQDGNHYWMPIQESLVAPWREEMGEGDDAEVFLLMVGAYLGTPVFTIASFQAMR